MWMVFTRFVKLIKKKLFKARNILDNDLYLEQQGLIDRSINLLQF